MLFNILRILCAVLFAITLTYYKDCADNPYLFGWIVLVSVFYGINGLLSEYAAIESVSDDLFE